MKCCMVACINILYPRNRLSAVDGGGRVGGLVFFTRFRSFGVDLQIFLNLKWPRNLVKQAGGDSFLILRDHLELISLTINLLYKVFTEIGMVTCNNIFIQRKISQKPNIRNKNGRFACFDTKQFAKKQQEPQS